MGCVLIHYVVSFCSGLVFSQSEYSQGRYLLMYTSLKLPSLCVLECGEHALPRN